MTHEVGYRKALNTLLSAQLAFVPREWMKRLPFSALTGLESGIKEGAMGFRGRSFGKDPEGPTKR